MGRKKIEIKFIENKKERAVTFCKRKHGLLKKAAELATLCGVKVSLLFTDLGDYPHYFSNDHEVKIEFDSNSKKKKDGAFMYTYTLDDYPFGEVLETQKREQRENDKNSDSGKIDVLGKRKTFTEFRDELVLRYKPISVTAPNPNPNDHMGNLRKLGYPKNLCVPSSEKKGPPLDFLDHDLKSIQSQGSAFYPYKTLDGDQLKSYEHFMSEMDSMVKEITSKNYKDPKRDEDLIQLLSLKQFINRYFGNKEPPFEADMTSRILRARVSIHDMILVLSSIKYKDKGIDMTLVTVKQFNDILLEILIHPTSFKTNVINFFQSGKNIVHVFIFMLKSLFQQVKVIKSIYCEDYPGIDSQHTFQHPTCVEILTGIITSVLELIAFESSHLVQQPNATQNFNSAFQLHSQKHSQEHGQPSHHIGHIQMAGGLVSSMQNMSNQGILAPGLLDIATPTPVQAGHMGSQENFDPLNSSSNYFEKMIRMEHRRKPELYSFEVHNRDYFKSDDESLMNPDKPFVREPPQNQQPKLPQSTNSVISELLKRPGQKPADLISQLYNIPRK